MNIFQFISVQLLHKRIRGGGWVKLASDMLTRGRGEGGQNFGKPAYLILEQSLIQWLTLTHPQKTNKIISLLLFEEQTSQ